ncbi:disulfide bond formation protein B [Polycladidibacter hongkongensis]|uniref:disulfide bond formation protein B n=1 Tax=Polycladidibacter hongkongensis TaxID=1647556 RepID=UPI00082F313E|nr:disulfide bond formation protein B [Pseudovibrio hongkongensis]
MIAKLFDRVLENPRAWAAGLLAAGSAFSIAMAWGFQLIGGYMPCQLCLAQRVPYYIGLPLSLLVLALSVKGKLRWLSALLLLLAAGIFMYGGGIGVYQAGAEWDFWLGPNDCGGGRFDVSQASNMLNALNNTRVVSCSTAALRIFGLSFAGMNVVFSSVMAFIAICGVVLPVRRKG